MRESGEIDTQIDEWRWRVNRVECGEGFSGGRRRRMSRLIEERDGERDGASK